MDLSKGYPFFTVPGQHVYRENLARFAAIAPPITGSLSILGSGCIIYILLKKEKKLATLKNRLLFVMSVVDIFYSFGLAFGPHPAPKGTPGVLRASGNTATCTTQGFLFHLGYMIPNYTASLSLSFLLSVRYNVPERFMEEKLEVYMHLYGILYPLITGVVSASLGLFNSNGSFCWINFYPNGCSVIPSLECTRGKHALLLSFLFGIVPLSLALLVIVVSMIMLMFTVYMNERKMKMRHSFVTATGRKFSFNTKRIKVVRQTCIQASCYLVSFVLTYLPSYIAFICQVTMHYVPASIFYLSVTLLPSFGFWNFIFVFLLQRFLEMKEFFPEKSVWWKLWKCVSEPNLKVVCTQRRFSSDYFNTRNCNRGDLHNITIVNNSRGRRLSNGINSSSLNDGSSAPSTTNPTLSMR